MPFTRAVSGGFRLVCRVGRPHVGTCWDAPVVSRPHSGPCGWPPDCDRTSFSLMGVGSHQQYPEPAGASPPSHSACGRETERATPPCIALPKEKNEHPRATPLIGGLGWRSRTARRFVQAWSMTRWYALVAGVGPGARGVCRVAGVQGWEVQRSGRSSRGAGVTRAVKRTSPPQLGRPGPLSGVPRASALGGRGVW